MKFTVLAELSNLILDAKISEADLSKENEQFLLHAIRDNWLSWSVEDIVNMIKLNLDSGGKDFAFLKGKSDEELEDIVDAAKDDARNQFESLNEDWGSSDWYPVMRAMEQYIKQGYSVDEAVSTCAARWYNDMGFDSWEDAEPAILARFKRLQANPRKHEPKASDKPVNEGMWVIKSKDGVEKRFKNDKSPEAIAWKDSIAKKSKVPSEKYSQEWWEYQENNAGFASDKVLPWTHIRRADVMGDDLDKVFEQAGWKQNNIDDWQVTGNFEAVKNGVTCAGIKIRVSYYFTKDDDIGIEGDEPVGDSQYIKAIRDPKQPSKLIFFGYA